MRILFFGDSITQGFWGSNGGWVEMIASHFNSLALKDLKNHDQPSVFNLGISADTTRNLLKRIESETRTRRRGQHKIIVVIAIGTNDDLFESDEQWVPPDKFTKNLEQIVDLVKPISDEVVLIGNPAVDESLTTPVFWGDFNYTNKELERSEETIKEVASAKTVHYIPMFKRFKSQLDEGTLLLSDGLHPNDEGHRFISEVVLKDLRTIIEKSKNDQH